MSGKCLGLHAKIKELGVRQMWACPLLCHFWAPWAWALVSLSAGKGWGLHSLAASWERFNEQRYAELPAQVLIKYQCSGKETCVLLSSSSFGVRASKRSEMMGWGGGRDCFESGRNMAQRGGPWAEVLYLNKVGTDATLEREREQVRDGVGALTPPLGELGDWWQVPRI